MKVLLTANPGFGHIHPMMPLALALAGRGHQVRWAVASDACARVEAAGFEAFAAGLAGPARRAAFDRCLGEVKSLAPERRPDLRWGSGYPSCACPRPQTSSSTPARVPWPARR